MKKVKVEGDKESKRFQCPLYVDGCKFIGTTQLNFICLTHTGEFEGCDHRCTQSGSLKRHMLTHTGERPFKCEVEGYNCRCTQNGDLKRYMLMHTGESKVKLKDLIIDVLKIVILKLI